MILALTQNHEMLTGDPLVMRLIINAARRDLAVTAASTSGEMGLMYKAALKALNAAAAYVPVEPTSDCIIDDLV